MEWWQLLCHTLSLLRSISLFCLFLHLCGVLGRKLLRLVLWLWQRGHRRMKRGETRRNLREYGGAFRTRPL